jgi:hypothetical protein
MWQVPPILWDLPHHGVTQRIGLGLVWKVFVGLEPGRYPNGGGRKSESPVEGPGVACSRVRRVLRGGYVPVILNDPIPSMLQRQNMWTPFFTGVK